MPGNVFYPSPFLPHPNGRPLYTLGLHCTGHRFVNSSPVRLGYFVRTADWDGGFGKCLSLNSVQGVRTGTREKPTYTLSAQFTDDLPIDV